MKLYIKNMVCNRCIMVVKSELEKLGYTPLSVDLGEAETDRELLKEEKKRLTSVLQELGFDLIDDRKSRLIERIKNLIIELVHEKDSQLKTSLSDYLTTHLYHDYHYLSNLFSEVVGMTIEKFFINQKIEKVKRAACL